KHTTLSDAHHISPKLKTYYSFAVVRHPYDWLFSLYKFIRFSNVSPDSGEVFRHVLRTEVEKMSFSDFVNWVTEEDGLLTLPSRRSSIFSVKTPVLQKDWVSDLDGNLLVDKVCKFEKLSEDFRLVIRHFGIDVGELTSRNQSRKD